MIACVTVWVLALAGAAHAQGVLGYEEQQNTVSVGVGATTSVSVACSPGNKVVGGGFNLQDPTAVLVLASQPTSGGVLSDHTWELSVHNIAKQAEQVTVTAICVSGSVAGYEEPTNTVTVPAGLSSDVSAACSAGNRVLGGGFSVQTAGVYSSEPTSKSTISDHVWDSFVSNGGGNSETATVTAICVTGSVSGYEEQSSSTFIPAGTSGTVSAACSAGALVVGGGFDVETPASVKVASSQPPSPNGSLSNNTWSLSARNNDPAGATRNASVVAVCVDPAPAVTSVKPSSGPAAGGTSVTITGTDLLGASAVHFGSNPANFKVNSPTQITATAPAGTDPVDVTVTTPGGTSATSPSDQFTYGPTVSSVSPSSGPAAGGTLVTVTGTGFTGLPVVKFGSTPGNKVSVKDSTHLVVVSPNGAGPVDVTVTTPAGTSPISAGDVFTYAPTVTGISPAEGQATGNTSVTITGAGFTNVSAVMFGATPAQSFRVASSTQVTATSPAGSAPVDVRVTTPGGTSLISAADVFTYAPSVTGVSPSSGPSAGGTSTIITGTGFGIATAVTFGSTPAAAFNVISETQIAATSPPGTGIADVTVTNRGGTSPPSPSDQFSYVPPPTVTGLSPSLGPISGGTPVTITGTNLTGATAVSFGGTQASTFTLESDSQITATSPAGTGTVDVTITTPSGTSATGSADRFAYVSVPPSVSLAAPIVQNSSAVAFSGSVNPMGLPTTAYFEYGLDSAYHAAGDGITYAASTPHQQVGSDFSSHQVSASVSGLVPNALYHARMVAINSAGTSYGPDQTFTTAKDPPPPAPVLGKAVNAAPVAGVVLVKLGNVFVPLTEARQLPSGTEIDALQGSLSLASATGKHRQTYTGTFGGAVFTFTQDTRGLTKGLTTLSLLEGAFPGAPSYASCAIKTAVDAESPVARAAALSGKVLQTLRASAHGRFRTRGRYAAATVRGTAWTTTDRCDGTLIAVQLHSVEVADLVRHITVLVSQGHHYLAKARK